MDGDESTLDNVWTRPKVFKMAGHWMWQCNHGHGLMGDAVRAEDWGPGHAVILGLAVKHWMMYHNDDPRYEVEDV